MCDSTEKDKKNNSFFLTEVLALIETTFKRLKAQTTYSISSKSIYSPTTFEDFLATGSDVCLEV